MTVENRTMRIVQIGPMPPPHGGVSTNMLAIHELLVRSGHESRIVDVTDRGREEDREFVLKPRSSAGLLKILAGSDADILHYHIGGEFSLKLALLAVLCGMLPGKRSIVTFHSGGYARSAIETAKPLSIRGLALRSQDLLIGVNAEMIKMFEGFGVKPERTRMIVPYELARPNSSVSVPRGLNEFAENSDPLIISVGSLEQEYRHEIVIDALPNILELFPNAGLLIAGSGTMRNDLENQVADLGLGDRVLLAGNVDHAVLLHLINRAGILLRITDFDGDAISVREALFLRTPVVATDNGMRPPGVSLVDESPGAGALAAKVIDTLACGRSESTETAVPESNAAKVIALYEQVIYG